MRTPTVLTPCYTLSPHAQPNAQFYAIPTAPGKSKLIAGFVSNMKLPAPLRKLSTAFDWVFHLGQQVVLDSDAYLLHVQVRR